MANMKMTKNPMPEQDPVVRAGNFDEVALGYTAEMAIDEAKRCLNCRDPHCRMGCPVSVRIPEFIAKVAAGDFDAAYEIITSTNSLPAVCGRVCPQEKQCESKCVRGIKGESVGIGRLERFVADYHMNKEIKDEIKAPESNGHRIAIVGSGPASLTCAGDLRKMGYDVTIFEAFHKSGGVLVYGIPQFRLPKEIVAAEIDNLKAMGVKIINNAIIGKSETVDELFEDGIIAWARDNSLEFIQCACRLTERSAADTGDVNVSKRKEIKLLLRRLRQGNPNIEKSIFNSIHAVALDTMPGFKTGGVEHSFLERFDAMQ